MTLFCSFGTLFSIHTNLNKYVTHRFLYSKCSSVCFLHLRAQYNSVNDLAFHCGLAMEGYTARRGTLPIIVSEATRLCHELLTTLWEVLANYRTKVIKICENKYICCHLLEHRDLRPSCTCNTQSRIILIGEADVLDLVCIPSVMHDGPNWYRKKVME